MVTILTIPRWSCTLYIRNSEKPFYTDRESNCSNTNISIRTMYMVSDIFVSPTVHKYKVTDKIIAYLNFTQILQLSQNCTNLYIHEQKHNEIQPPQNVRNILSPFCSTTSVEQMCMHKII